MTKRREIIIRSRQQGKTEDMREKTKEAMEQGKQIYLPAAPSIADDDPPQPS